MGETLKDGSEASMEEVNRPRSTLCASVHEAIRSSQDRTLAARRLRCLR